jgi:VIT1/CCC1 family predicted Fe2+/Mn2+ transporter
VYVATAMRDYEYMTSYLDCCSPAQSNEIREEISKLFPEMYEQELSSLRFYHLPQADDVTNDLNRSLIRILPFLNRIKSDKISSWAQPDSVSTWIRGITSTILAISGGALIIVPIIIMSFDTSRTKSLITISIAVLFFAFVLGAITRSKGSEIFIATATYAAVLVVFVGTSTNSTTATPSG